MSCELYCKYIKFTIKKVLTATASDSSRYVYVKYTFDVQVSLGWNAD